MSQNCQQPANWSTVADLNVYGLRVVILARVIITLLALFWLFVLLIAVN
jgi:hypothetical protein